MGKLITPSILNSMNFARSARGEWKEKGLADFKNQLSRIYADEMPAPIRRGLDFEDAVYKRARMLEGSWKGSPMFHEIVDQCRGGRFQVKAKKDMKVDGVNYTLYGKLDVDFPDRILDLKTTNKYRPPQKYLSTPQHLIYSWCTGKDKFTYLVVVLDEQNRIVEHYNIDWESPGREEVGRELERIIRDFRVGLEEMGLTELYLDKFCLF